LVCPDEGPGLDRVSLSEGNVRGSEEYAARVASRPIVDGIRSDTGGDEYRNNPVGILGNLLLGWWFPSTMIVKWAIDQASSSQAYNGLSSDEKTGFDALSVLDAGKAGVSYWRNQMPRYRDSAEEISLPYDRFLDLAARDDIYAPDYNDGDMRFRTSSQNGFTRVGGRKRLDTIKGDLICPSLSNPCVWIVYKNMAPSKITPNSYLFSLDIDGAEGTSTNKLRLGYSALSGTWHVFGDYSSNSSHLLSLGSDVEVLNKRMIWSARMESLQLVCKIADTEFAKSLPDYPDDGIADNVYHMQIGNYTDGEISEVILTADVPTDAQISEIEAYLKKAHTDIEETL